MKPIALQLYTVRQAAEKDFIATLKQVAEMGYHGVELFDLYGHDPEEVRKVTDDLGMKVCSKHVALNMSKEALSEQIESARILGYDMLVVSYGPPEKFTSLDGVREVAGVLKGMTASLEGTGLRLGYHNHAHEMQIIDGKYALQILFDEVPELCLQIDTYWASNFGVVDVPALVAANSARITSLHIKDGPLVAGEANTAIGSGRMDFRPIIAAADESVLEWLIVEFDKCDTDMMAAVHDSIRYLTSSASGEGNE